MKWGVLGGTFDPVHLGHLKIAGTAREQLGLEKVLFIPAFLPPHKQMQLPHATPGQRLEMLQLAIKDNTAFFADSCEIDRGDVSYTCDTLSSLHQRFEGCEFYLLMGADSWNSISTWKNADQIMSLAKAAVVERPGEELRKYAAYSAVLLNMEKTAVSSSDVRERILSGKSLEGLVPESVIAYIKKHDLYKV